MPGGSCWSRDDTFFSVTVKTGLQNAFHLPPPTPRAQAPSSLPQRGGPWVFGCEPPEMGAHPSGPSESAEGIHTQNGQRWGEEPQRP